MAGGKRSKLAALLDFFLHLDRHLEQVIRDHGPWTYGILSGIVFAETGFVVTPFLPGDSLLFAAGIFTAPGKGLNLPLIILLLSLAAICGDNVNYVVGRTFGERLFTKEDSRFFKRSHLDKTHAFLEQYGPKAIILARFVPIVRTFMPFVAGMGRMTYLKFLGYSIFAAFFWVTVCAGAGHLFGGIEAVRKNFSIAALAVVGLSLVPIAIEYLRHRARRRQQLPSPPEA